MSFTIEEFEGDLIILNDQKEKNMQQHYQILGAIGLLEQQIKTLKNCKEKITGKESNIPEFPPGHIEQNIDRN